MVFLERFVGLFFERKIARIEKELDQEMIDFNAGILALELALDEICQSMRANLNQTRLEVDAVITKRVDKSHDILEQRIQQIEADQRLIVLAIDTAPKARVNSITNNGLFSLSREEF